MTADPIIVATDATHGDDELVAAIERAARGRSVRVWTSGAYHPTIVYRGPDIGAAWAAFAREADVVGDYGRRRRVRIFVSDEEVLAERGDYARAPIEVYAPRPLPEALVPVEAARLTRFARLDLDPT